MVPGVLPPLDEEPEEPEMGLCRWTRTLLPFTTSSDWTRPRARSWLRLGLVHAMGSLTHNSCQVISRVECSPGEVIEYRT